MVRFSHQGRVALLLEFAELKYESRIPPFTQTHNLLNLNPLKTNKQSSSINYCQTHHYIHVQNLNKLPMRLPHRILITITSKYWCKLQAKLMFEIKYEV